MENKITLPPFEQVVNRTGLNATGLPPKPSLQQSPVTPSVPPSPQRSQHSQSDQHLPSFVNQQRSRSYPQPQPLSAHAPYPYTTQSIPPNHNIPPSLPPHQPNYIPVSSHQIPVMIPNSSPMYQSQSSYRTSPVHTTNSNYLPPATHTVGQLPHLPHPHPHPHAHQPIRSLHQMPMHPQQQLLPMPPHSYTQLHYAPVQSTLLPSREKPKRQRRKAHEMVRWYTCNFENCENAYGTLNHLNAHIQIKRHGPKRRPEEFKEIREMLKLEAKKRKDETEK